MTKLNCRANLHRRELSRVVQRWQQAAELSGGELAERAGWSSAKMSMLLNAHQAMSEADFLTLAMILKADPVLRDRGLSSVRAALGQADAGQNGLKWTLADLEAEAQELRIYASETVPPLLRTTAYDDLVRSSLPAAVQACHERYDTELRQATLDKLAERPHRRVHAVFAEAVLVSWVHHWVWCAPVLVFLALRGNAWPAFLAVLLVFVTRLYEFDGYVWLAAGMLAVLAFRRVSRGRRPTAGPRAPRWRRRTAAPRG